MRITETYIQSKNVDTQLHNLLKDIITHTQCAYSTIYIYIIYIYIYNIYMYIYIHIYIISLFL